MDAIKVGDLVTVKPEAATYSRYLGGETVRVVKIKTGDTAVVDDVPFSGLPDQMIFLSDLELPPVLPAGVSRECLHEWKTYTGLKETFQYCERCDEKRPCLS